METKMRVLVTGGRNYSDRSAVDRVLDSIHMERGISVLIHGGAAGADELASEWAYDSGIVESAFPANWDKHGRAAGPIRNKQMLVEGKPDLVVAFPGGKGTQNMVRQARDSGVEVYEV
jgi:YspA, cpYpsA-related SLOG family